ncbi:hypothetical protein SAMN04487936_106234 [Halobacillus dabanensis]|uniref:DUF3953 domain-containing protein n=1 Tax=Halobacillus dabanensis TaxID=240302 RepID=A0A1I3W709_HALDA|nr:hypothetical protein SAMN04487936_106234 [Halobacillus dabanensis]
MRIFRVFISIYGVVTLIVILADLFSTYVTINFTIIANALAGLFFLLAVQDVREGRKKWSIFYIIIGCLYLYTGISP